MNRTSISKRLVSLLLVLVFLFTQMGIGTAVEGPVPYEPFILSFTGPANYPDLGEFKVKFDNISASSLETGKVYFGKISDEKIIYLKRTASNAIEWSSTFPILAVYVKGGKGGGIETYPSGAESGGPITTGGKFGVSHVTFYYGDIPIVPPVVPQYKSVSLTKTFGEATFPEGEDFKFELQYTLGSIWVNVQDAEEALSSDGIITLNKDNPSATYIVPAAATAYQVREIGTEDYELVSMNSLTEADPEGWFFFTGSVESILVTNKATEIEEPNPTYTIRITKLLRNGSVPTDLSFDIDLYQRIFVPDEANGEDVVLNDATGEWIWELFDTAKLSPGNSESYEEDVAPGWFAVKETPIANYNLFQVTVNGVVVAPEDEVPLEGYHLFELLPYLEGDDVVVEVIVTNDRRPVTQTTTTPTTPTTTTTTTTVVTTPTPTPPEEEEPEIEVEAFDEPVIPLDAPDVEEKEVVEIMLEEVVPLDVPALPQTSGLPLGMLLMSGFAVTGLGLKLRKK